MGSNLIITDGHELFLPCCAAFRARVKLLGSYKAIHALSGRGTRDVVECFDNRDGDMP